jgi:hypothetical protein
MKNIFFNKDELEDLGFYIIKNLISEDLLKKLRNSIIKSFKKHKVLQNKNNIDIPNYGVALNVIKDDPTYLELLEYFIEIGFINQLKKDFFKSEVILNSISALSNEPFDTNFSSVIHRDSKCFSHNQPFMINLLIMLDDFTENNGPTLLLPKSHKIIEKPTDEYFEKNSIKALGQSGDVIIFNSDIWHASTKNETNKSRRAIPITLSKPFIKQLLDYPRYIGYKNKEKFSVELSSLLGYDSRVPSNLEEWYQPTEKRFYKKNQDQ